MDTTQLFDDVVIPTFTSTDMFRSVWVYLGILLFQLILLFRRQWSSLIIVLIQHLKRRLSSKYETSVRVKSNPSLSSMTRRNEKVIKVVSYHDLQSFSPSFKLVTDDESEVRYRFSIFRLNTYADVSQIMAQCAILNLDLLSTTILFNSHDDKILMFYVGYFGHKLTLTGLENEPSSVLFSG